MNPQAAELNNTLEADGPIALALLSERGRRIFFPRKGVVAQGLDAQGKSINASIGEAKEEDGSPLRLSPLAKRINLPPSEVFTYASSFGKPAIRDRWATMIRTKNPSLGNTPISRPVVTNALTHGLSVVAYMFVNQGDQIILPHLYWGNYRLIFAESCAAEMLTFPTFDSNQSDAAFNVSSLASCLSSNGEKKILLLNFPNNPTGYTPTEKEMNAIVDTVKKAAEAGKKILTIVDDAYFGLVFRKGIAAESPFGKFASLHENVVACKVDGATKEDYVWGFRVGFISFAGKGLGTESLAALEDKAAGVVRGSISNDSHLAQSLLLAAYDDPAYSSEKKRAFQLLKSRHDAVVSVLEKHSEYADRFVALPFNSGYFMCVRVGNGNAELVRQKLLKDYDTGIIALDDLVRIAYSSLPTAQIPRLFANLYAACGEV